MFLNRVAENGFTPAALFSDLATKLNGTGPVGVAVSGGGDSLALLHLLTQWGQRPLEVFCVDHGIHPDGARWSESVAAQATRLGAGFTGLTWREVKPSSGLAAAARKARHTLLAEAARARGCRVLCLGHTADDVIEARAMRAEGSNVGSPQLWAPSPVWPQGRGLFLYRPLLKTRRAALREWLRARGTDWIDDPANENPRSLRARMRQNLTDTDAQDVADDGAWPGDLPDGLIYDPQGWSLLGLLRLDAERLVAMPEASSRRLLAMAAVCAGGDDQLPRHSQITHLETALRHGGVSTLCGARVWQENGHVHLVREAGEMRRRTVPLIREGAELIWDGRFALSGVDEAVIRPSDGLRARLPKTDRRWLESLPAALRAVLPVVDREGLVLARPSGKGADSPPLSGPLSVSGLVVPRFLAAIGAITTEDDLDLT